MPKRHCNKPIKYYSAKRRAIYATGDQITHLELFERHQWVCWLCSEPINPFLRSPNYKAGTIDHKIPLSKGGTHTWDNVAPAHAICNFQKGASLPNQVGGTMEVCP